MKAIFLSIRILFSAAALLIMSTAEAGKPLWMFEALTSTTVDVPANDTTIVQYKITNQSMRTRTLVMKPIQGITQLTSGPGVSGIKQRVRILMLAL